MEALSEAIARAEASFAEAIVIDLEDLTFIDSSGIRLILLTHLRVVACNGRLRLRRGPPAVQRVFEISGIEDEFAFVD